MDPKACIERAWDAFYDGDREECRAALASRLDTGGARDRDTRRTTMTINHYELTIVDGPHSGGGTRWPGVPDTIRASSIDAALRRAVEIAKRGMRGVPEYGDTRRIGTCGPDEWHKPTVTVRVSGGGRVLEIGLAPLSLCRGSIYQV